ncbi:MAG TPA: M1 family metallopeptidase [Bacteroidota bacterium]|nr:M1 family metallopeptidase [Bacteroidota bacterium]
MKILCYSTVLCSILATTIVTAGEGNDPRMDKYDVQHYDLAVTFNLGEESLSGCVEMTARAITPLDVCVLSADKKTLTVDSVFGQTSRLSFSTDSGSVAIRMASTILSGRQFSLKVFYHAASKFSGQYDDGGIYFTRSGHIASSGEPQFARRWWPCKDIPSDKATVSSHFTVPDSITVASNGLLQSVDRHNGLATYNWNTKYPISTYLVSVAAAHYVELHDTYHALNGKPMQMVYYVYPEDSAKALSTFKDAPDYLSFMSHTFCEYPFVDEKFGYAEVEGDLTMENQTICSIQNTIISSGNDRDLTVFHETAHHWFGDLITTVNWHHTWLNEGFATYMEALYAEHTGGKEAYQKRINRMMNVPLGFYRRSVVGQSDTAFWDSFGASVYFKGAIVLHMLRQVLGDSDFFASLRSYVNDPRFRYGNAGTGDFEKVCESVSRKNLHGFFQQWVYTSVDSLDRPVLRYRWKTAPSTNGVGLTLTIKQENTPHPVYTLKLPIEVHEKSGTSGFSVVDSLPEQSFQLIVDSAPDSIAIDPENTVFKLAVKDHP